MHLHRLKLLLNDATELSRHFIDLFSPSLVFVKPMLLQLKDSLAVADNAEKMRNDSILNPLGEGDHMSQPTLKMVSMVCLTRIECTVFFDIFWGVRTVHCSSCEVRICICNRCIRFHFPSSLSLYSSFFFILYSFSFLFLFSPLSSMVFDFVSFFSAEQHNTSLCVYRADLTRKVL